MLILPWRGRFLRLHGPCRVIRRRGWRAVEEGLNVLLQEVASGLWGGGWLAFPHPEHGPTLYAEVHRRSPQTWREREKILDCGLWLAPLRAAWDEAAYQRAFAVVQEALRRGESYQVNLTFPLFTRLLRAGSAGRVRPTIPTSTKELVALWQEVGRGTRHDRGGLVVPPRRGGRWAAARAVLSWSPELWVRGQRTRKGWVLESEPMKGTAPRDADPAKDRQQALSLIHSAKTRAENLMIVDMVRHELAQMGLRVRVPRLFSLKALSTLWQMTSTVMGVGPLARHPLLGALWSLFPPASVTGAPKSSTLRWIARAEGEARGVYTGVTFLVSPRGSFEGSVAIRTLELNLATGRARFGVGGGVLIDSDPQAEHREALSKAQFLRRCTLDFRLLESLRWEPEKGVPLWELHIRRLARSARTLGRPFDAELARRTVENLVQSHTSPLKVRLLLGPRGELEAQAEPLGDLPSPLRLKLAPCPIHGQELLRWHKTDRREIYARFAPGPGEEVVLWDEAGRVLEGTFTNLAFRLRGRWVTPSEGVFLRGVMRQHLLAEGRIIEAPVSLEEAMHSPEVACFNAVRGWMEARWSD